MDPRLVVPEKPRPGVPPGLAELPLFTLAWRALKAEATQNQSRIAQAEEMRSREKKRRQALLALANEIFRLQKAGASGATLTAVERIEQALLDLGVEIVAPVGEDYTEGLMEVLDNLAQQPTPGLQQARIHEVVVPTILIDGDVAQIGKAVIAVPETVKTDAAEKDQLRLENPVDAEQEQLCAEQGQLRQDRDLADEIKQMNRYFLENDTAEQGQLRNKKSGGENG